MNIYAETAYPLTEIDHLPLNRVESNALYHWELLIETNQECGWFDDEIDTVHLELDFFFDCVLPKEPTEGWAMWTDGVEILTKSEEIAARISRVMDLFADGHYGYYDPEEDERNNEVTNTTGYWYVDWD